MRREIVELHGRVQGVGFRATVADIARRHAVHGSVVNLRSGGVEIDAEGDDEILEGFIQDVLQHPPRWARIEDIKRTPAEPRGVRGFNVRSDR